jgi:hypothetical protein
VISLTVWGSWTRPADLGLTHFHGSTSVDAIPDVENHIKQIGVIITTAPQS